MEENDSNVTVINKFAESEEVNAELRNFADKLRGSKERVCDASACLSVTDRNLVTPATCEHGTPTAASDAAVQHSSSCSHGVASSTSSKTSYPRRSPAPAPVADEKCYSADADDDDAAATASAKSSIVSRLHDKKATFRQARPRLTTYLKDWLQLKEKRNREYLEKYLRTHPVVSEYKREHIRKFGKPTFMNNAQAYLRRKEFVVNHSRLDT